MPIDIGYAFPILVFSIVVPFLVVAALLIWKETHK